MSVFEKISAFTKSDYDNRIVNLHIHTTYSDGVGNFRDIVTQAKQNGYSTISITDHNTVQGHIDNADLSDFVITGVEFDVWYKYIFLHLLAYGIDIKNSSMQKFYAKNKSETEKDILRIFAKRDIKELIDSIHKAGGIAVLAHPACCWALNMEKFVRELKALGLDGIEIYYPYPRWRKYLRFISNDEIEKIADKYNLIKTGGTDLHDRNIC